MGMHPKDCLWARQMVGHHRHKDAFLCHHFLGGETVGGIKVFLEKKSFLKVLLCPSLLMMIKCCILLLLVDLSQVMWGPSRHLGSITAANWVSFDFNVSYSSG